MTSRLGKSLAFGPFTSNIFEFFGRNAAEAPPPAQTDNDTEFQWSLMKIKLSILLFCAAGAAEIIGGYMIWATLRGNSNGKKPWWVALLGSALLVAYGFIHCLQPTDEFGRIYAVYGGFFIVLSFVFGWVFDGNRPDTGDVVGCCIALGGVLLIQFWPR